MKYQYILLDADNTLFDFDACEKEAFYYAMHHFGVDATEDMYARYNIINANCWKALERGELTRESLQITRYQRLMEEFSLSLDPKETNECYLGHLATVGILYPGAVEFVKTLSENAQVYIITNGLARVQVGRFRNCPLVPYLKSIFISEDMGASKPDPAFFEAVAKKIDGFEKSRAIVIGDSLTSDIQGANNYDLDCIWYNPKKKAKGNQKIDYIVSDYDEILRILN